jgi:hypothetical protein
VSGAHLLLDTSCCGDKEPRLTKCELESVLEKTRSLMEIEAKYEYYEKRYRNRIHKSPARIQRQTSVMLEIIILRKGIS